MKIMNPLLSDFTSSIERTSKNTLCFENSSVFTPYVNPNGTTGDSTILGLYKINNVILEKLIPYLKSVSSFTMMSEDQEKKYRNKPMLLSYDTYGLIDYWYILLAINGYISPYEFKHFKYLYIPAVSDIESIVDAEFYKKTNIGV
jgi:hypothetical protein